MSLEYPSRAFDDAVAALCHGTATDDQMLDLHELLGNSPAARDEYLLRVELHTRLASDPDLFAEPAPEAEEPAARATTPVASAPGRHMLGRPRHRRKWHAVATVCMAFLLAAGSVWYFAGLRHRGGKRAVAMLNRSVNARWHPSDEVPRLGAPLEPGRLRLQSGLAQIVFYNGARVVIEGPAELRLVSPGEAVCSSGKLTAEVPPQARGFRITSPRMEVTDLGTSFGLNIQGEQADLHVFAGQVEFRSAGVTNQGLSEGRGVVVEGVNAPRPIAADPTQFTSLFEMQTRSMAADALRYDQWRASNRRWNLDESLRIHLDFEQGGPGVWRLPNTGAWSSRVLDTTVVGCQWVEGRWETKPALEFRGVSDRIRLNVPDTADSVTLATWVRVQGLDRQVNSLFMADGFADHTLHWLIRNDGVLGLTVIGSRGAHQILTSPPVMTMDQFGIWTHLAVTIDGRKRQAVHYVNGLPVSRHDLRFDPPYELGAAEIGNWNPVGFPGGDPFLIRNFSGVMDEFFLFSRALDEAEVLDLYTDGRPQSSPLTQARN